MRSLRRAFGILIVVLVAIPSFAGAQAAPGGRASSPLTLQVTCDARGQTPLMRVQIANTSDRPTALVLGFTADKGRTQVVNSVQVVAIRPATGADEAYVYVNPRHALTQGPPWVVSLPAGATHEIELPLQDFISGMTYNSLDPSVAAGARLVFEARPAAKQSASVWTGSVETKIGPCLE